MCLIKQRAKKPEQKALRRQQIIDATRERFKTLPYEEVNLNHIAQDVGITKAALYRYFKNKETLFLALFEQTLEELIASVEQTHLTLTQQTHSDKPGSKLAALITQTLVTNPVYCKLSAILHTVLECNLSAEEALAFKTHVLKLTRHYAHLLAQYVPEFKQEDYAIETLMQIQAALIGTWHMTHPRGEIAKVIQTPKLAVFNRQFESTLHALIEKIVASPITQ